MIIYVPAIILGILVIAFFGYMHWYLKNFSCKGYDGKTWYVIDAEEDTTRLSNITISRYLGHHYYEKTLDCRSWTSFEELSVYLPTDKVCKTKFGKKLLSLQKHKRFDQELEKATKERRKMRDPNYSG